MDKDLQSLSEPSYESDDDAEYKMRMIERNKLEALCLLIQELREIKQALTHSQQDATQLQR